MYNFDCYYRPENYLTKVLGDRIYLFNKKTKLAFSLKAREYKLLLYLNSSSSNEDLLSGNEDTFTRAEADKFVEKLNEIGAFNYQQKKPGLVSR